MKITSRLGVLLAKIAGNEATLEHMVPPWATHAEEELMLEIADRVDGLESASVPEVASTDKGKYLHANESTGALEWAEASGGGGSSLPAVTSADKGKSLAVQEIAVPGTVIAAEQTVSDYEDAQHKGAKLTSINANLFTEGATVQVVISDIAEQSMGWVLGTYTGTVVSAEFKPMQPQSPTFQADMFIISSYDTPGDPIITACVWKETNGSDLYFYCVDMAEFYSIPATTLSVSTASYNYEWGAEKVNGLPDATASNAGCVASVWRATTGNATIVPEQTVSITHADPSDPYADMFTLSDTDTSFFIPGATVTYIYNEIPFVGTVEGDEYETSVWFEVGSYDHGFELIDGVLSFICGIPDREDATISLSMPQYDYSWVADDCAGYSGVLRVDINSEDTASVTVLKGTVDDFFPNQDLNLQARPRPIYVFVDDGESYMGCYTTYAANRADHTININAFGPQGTIEIIWNLDGNHAYVDINT